MQELIFYLFAIAIGIVLIYYNNNQNKKKRNQLLNNNNKINNSLNIFVEQNNYCSNCGEHMKPTYNYCINCGSKIILRKKINSNNNNNKYNNNYYQNVKYEKRKFMTQCEQKFYHILKELEPKYKIIPQINLGTIIDKNKTYRLDLFRNIDFGIFDETVTELLLLIEINDSSHKRPDRIKRDKQVKEICQKANVKLITFYTHYPNKKEYVLNRIKKELGFTEQEEIEII